jgi:hypothetical protein
VIGALIGLPGWSTSDSGATVAAIAVAAGLTISLQTWAAFFAGIGRGYIAPLAWTVTVIVVSQVLTVLAGEPGSRGLSRRSSPGRAERRWSR